MWPFESAKAISAAINVLNDHAHTVLTLDRDKLWRMPRLANPDPEPWFMRK
jgi:hypothetical protein